jgi:3',5'-cyclic-AMP phosphodiesterase
MHHPPFASGIGHMDLEFFVHRKESALVIGKYPQVVGITRGHVHRSITTQFAGRPATIAPGVGMQIPVDLSIEAPSQFIVEPPGFLLHFYADRSGDDPIVTTYIEWVTETEGLYGPRHPFSD